MVAFGLELYQSAIIAGVLAGVVAILVTRLIEFFGGVIGGVLSSTPTTIVFVSLGFAATLKDKDELRLSLYVVPMGMLIDALFLIVWRVLPGYLDHKRSTGRNLAILISSSLMVWLVLAAGSYFLNTELLDKNVTRVLVAGLVSLGLIIVLGLGISFHHVAAPKGGKPVPWGILLLRGLFAAIVIGITVYLGTFSPTLGGILATFPVIFTTTMVALWVSQGSGVPTGAAGPLILGSSSVGVYALVFAVVQPDLGMGAAFGIAYGSAILSISVPSFLFLRFMSAWHQRRRVGVKTQAVGIGLESQRASIGLDGAAEALPSTHHQHQHQQAAPIVKASNWIDPANAGVEPEPSEGTDEERRERLMLQSSRTSSSFLPVDTIVFYPMTEESRRLSEL